MSSPAGTSVLAVAAAGAHAVSMALLGAETGVSAGVSCSATRDCMSAIVLNATHWSSPSHHTSVESGICWWITLAITVPSGSGPCWELVASTQ